MSEKIKLVAMLCVLSLLPVLSGCDQGKESQKSTQATTSGTVSVSSLAPSLAGDYLAARFAVGKDDLQSANVFYQRAISETKKNKSFLVERALPAAIGAGDMASALALSHAVDLDKPLATSQLAVTLLLVDAFKQNDLARVEELLLKLREDGFGRLLKPLMEVWLDEGRGHAEKALARLTQFGKNYPSLRALAELHMAFIYDVQGNADKAEKLYAKTLRENLSVRTAWIVGQFYERERQPDKAIALYTALSGKMQSSPFAQLVIRRMQNKEAQNPRFIAKPKDGVAAALYDVATVLHQESSSRLAILYAQMAYDLAPEDPFVNLLLGDIMATASVPDSAKTFYENVSADSDLYVLARFRLAQFYELKEQNDKAIAILQDLAKDPLVERQAFVEMGDIQRRQENFAGAIPYYTKALALIDKPIESDWTVYYARGISYERTKQWEKAEIDLLKALQLSPQQPEVLNYLAYSWADNGRNLDKSLDMLQNALASAPNDPYIIDSVGWALFKTGRYEDAVPYLEASIQQLPDDPTINDHLGDIYWCVGRKTEARFQWERALKHVNSHDDGLKDRLKEKLENGLGGTSGKVVSRE